MSFCAESSQPVDLVTSLNRRQGGGERGHTSVLATSGKAAG
jgi:hypothetical protein